MESVRKAAISHCSSLLVLLLLAILIRSSEGESRALRTLLATKRQSHHPRAHPDPLGQEEEQERFLVVKKRKMDPTPSNPTPNDFTFLSGGSPPETNAIDMTKRRRKRSAAESRDRRRRRKSAAGMDRRRRRKSAAELNRRRRRKAAAAGRSRRRR